MGKIPYNKIYGDLLSPAFKEIGQLLRKVIKSTRFILVPFEYLAALHEKWEKHLERVAIYDNRGEGYPDVMVIDGSVPLSPGLDFSPKVVIILGSMPINTFTQTLGRCTRLP